MSTQYTQSREDGAQVFKVNDKIIATVDGRRVEPETPGPYFDAENRAEALDGARAVAEAYAAGYDAGLAEGAPVSAQRELRAAGQMIAEAFRRGDDWAIDIKTPTARNLPRFILDDRREATDALHQIGALYLDLRTAVQS